MGRGASGGGDLRTSGSTLAAHDEWTAVMSRQESAMESPMSR